jgi:phosphatidylserine/phosphatidylglycerophosphate/cardiolipin synthase-like enzyme
MRTKKRTGIVKGLAVAGTDVVALGWDVAATEIAGRGILGFAIQRTRASDGQVDWLPGMKTFESVLPHPGLGVLVSSHAHPFQTFQWSDYAVKPAQQYSYRIVAMTGNPAQLKEGPSLKLDVKTESGKTGKHSVFFNRGAVASQEYARRFQNRSPEEVGPAAWDWLSRGLIEALEAFIGQAGEGDELHGAIFEFKHKRVYDALKAAKQRKAKVWVIYDGKSEGERNRSAMNLENVSGWLKVNTQLRARANTGGYAHNKFLVLTRNGVPKQVWTGSTNLSVNGIFGHSNNGHVVRDDKVARAYKAYWTRLWDDPRKPALAPVNAQESPVPPPDWTDETVAVFSPQPGAAALDWYALLAGKPKRALFTTFAFGMNKLFVPIYERRDGTLRFALMEKKGNGSQLKEQSKVIDRIRRLPNTVIAVGDAVARENAFDRWLVERVKVVNEAHVLFVHTKYMLIDPLGDEPIVIVGSANFSKASCDTNDENMLVIRGNAEVADIYLGEFMRLFTHYAYRESLGFARSSATEYEKRRRYLVESTDWIKGEAQGQGYFEKGGARALRRVYFSGG